MLQIWACRSRLSKGSTVSKGSLMIVLTKFPKFPWKVFGLQQAWIPKVKICSDYYQASKKLNFFFWTGPPGPETAYFFPAGHLASKTAKGLYRIAIKSFGIHPICITSLSLVWLSITMPFRLRAKNFLKSVQTIIRVCHRYLYSGALLLSYLHCCYVLITSWPQSLSSEMLLCQLYMQTQHWHCQQKSTSLKSMPLHLFPAQQLHLALWT